MLFKWPTVCGNWPDFCTFSSEYFETSFTVSQYLWIVQFRFSNTIDSPMSQRTQQGLPGNLNVDWIGLKYNINAIFFLF